LLYPLAIRPDGKNIAIGSRDQVLIWDIKAQKITKTLQVEYGIGDVAYSPDGRLLAVGCESKFTVLWNARTYERIANLGEGTFENTFSFSPDSQLLAISDDYEKVIRFWDTKTLQVAFVIELDGWLGKGYNSIRSISFSPDGRFLAVGGYIGRDIPNEGVLQLWDIQIRHLVSDLDFPGRVRAIAFSPDGCLLAGVGSEIQSFNEFMRVFVTRTQQPIATLQMTPPTSGAEFGFSFSPDGSTLAVGLYYGGGGILLWKIEHN
jgi:WD40 repeat protein